MLKIKYLMPLLIPLTLAASDQGTKQPYIPGGSAEDARPYIPGGSARDARRTNEEHKLYSYLRNLFRKNNNQISPIPGGSSYHPSEGFPPGGGSYTPPGGGSCHQSIRKDQ